MLGRRSVTLRSCALPLLLVFMMQSSARADKVQKLITQLSRSANYKVRLSAALSLAKLRDRRAIGPFVTAMRDSNKTVRGVAAAALGKLIDRRTSRKLRASAMTALKRASQSDSNAFVRRQATKALAALGGYGAGTQAPRGGGYVNIGKMSATQGSRAMVELMRDTVRATVKRKGASLATSWPGGAPSKAQLRSRNTKGFYIDGSLTELKTTKQGSGAIVSCKVKLLVATYPERSMFAFPSGGAKVQSSGSRSQVALAKKDCVAAVVEALVGGKVIPTLQARMR